MKCNSTNNKEIILSLEPYIRFPPVEIVREQAREDEDITSRPGKTLTRPGVKSRDSGIRRFLRLIDAAAI